MDRRQTAALVAASAALSCGLALAVARMRKRTAPAHDERVVPSLPGGAALDESVDSSVDSIADALPHIVWRSSADGSRRYSNARWSEATGLPVEASKGRGWLESIAPGRPGCRPPTSSGRAGPGSMRSGRACRSRSTTACATKRRGPIAGFRCVPCPSSMLMAGSMVGSVRTPTWTSEAGARDASRSWSMPALAC